MIPEHRPTRLPVFLASALSKLYKLGIDRQNSKYDHGINVTTLDRPVISIGNLSAGGTGKTPLVQHVARLLLESGHHPVIAMRGYKAKPGVPGDEQLEHMDSLPDVPVVAQPDRIDGLKQLFLSEAGSKVDCVILDDGYQHRKIHRDVNIVVIDASRPPHKDALLPLGFLRESIESLRRADLLVMTHAEQVADERVAMNTEALRPFLRDAPVVIAEHHWGGLDEYRCDESLGKIETNEYAVDAINGKRVAVLCGIGHPEAFVKMATNAGAKLVYRCDRPDHDAFSEPVIEKFFRAARGNQSELVLTTRKDWTKLKPRILGLSSTHLLPVIVPQLQLKLRNGEKLLSEVVRSAFLAE